MTTTNANLEWLLENLVTNTRGAAHALVLSRDGLKLCHTRGLTVDKADQLSAIAPGSRHCRRGRRSSSGTAPAGCASR